MGLASIGSPPHRRRNAIPVGAFNGAEPRDGRRCDTIFIVRIMTLSGLWARQEKLPYFWWFIAYELRILNI